MTIPEQRDICFFINGRIRRHERIALDDHWLQKVTDNDENKKSILLSAERNAVMAFLYRRAAEEFAKTDYPIEYWRSKIVKIQATWYVTR